MLDLFRMRIRRGITQPPTLEEAHEYRRIMAESGTPSVAATHDLIGSVERVVPNLKKLAAAAEVDEVMVLSFAADPAARRHSYELLADAFALQPLVESAV